MFTVTFFIIVRKEKQQITQMFQQLSREIKCEIVIQGNIMEL